MATPKYEILKPFMPGVRYIEKYVSPIILLVAISSQLLVCSTQDETFQISWFQKALKMNLLSEEKNNLFSLECDDWVFYCSFFIKSQKCATGFYNILAAFPDYRPFFLSLVCDWVSNSYHTVWRIIEWRDARPRRHQLCGPMPCVLFR